MKKKGKREKGKKEGKINSLIKEKGEMCGYFYSSLHPTRWILATKRVCISLKNHPPPSRSWVYLFIIVFFAEFCGQNDFRKNIFWGKVSFKNLVLEVKFQFCFSIIQKISLNFSPRPRSNLPRKMKH